MVLTRAAQAARETGAASIRRLPHEVLVEILSRVRKSDDLRSFLRTDKSMLAMATDPVLMAGWLAIRRPGGRGLTIAAHRGLSGVMIQLFEMGVSATDVIDAYGKVRTPLQLCAKHGLLDVLSFLWQKAAVRSEEHVAAAYSALRQAARFGHAACCELLLTPPSSLLDANGVACMQHRCPLHSSVHHASSLECVQVLLDKGASCLTLSYGRNALHYCCMKSDNETLRARVLHILLSTPQGLSVIDAQTQSGLTPLHLAAINNLSSCCGLLLRFGSQAVNAHSDKGNTHSVVLNGTPKCSGCCYNTVPTLLHDQYDVDGVCLLICTLALLTNMCLLIYWLLVF